MNSLKTEESCVENKQSITASGSSVSEGSSEFSTLSPACSPATSSPNHRRTSGPIRRAKGGWTPIEDETLRHAVELHKGRNWKKIAESVLGRTEVQCLHRWQKVLNPELIKGPWTPEEDSVIIDLVAKYGPTKWSVIAGSLPGRIGKQCRERWHNHLNPEIRKDAWTSEEEMELMKAHFQHGNKWAEIAKMLPGRSDNSIKNHWNSSLRKRSEVYAITGKFLHAQKPAIQNTVKDTENSRNRRLFFCSSNELNAGGNKSVPDNSTVLHSSPCENHKMVGVMAITSAQISQINATVDETIRLSESSNSGEKLDAYSFNGKVSLNEERIETNLYLSPESTGSLCYKPPQLEDLGTSCLTPLISRHRSMQSADQETSSSPISHSTPSSVNAMRYASKSVESILKTAARSFPNTPSIIKRRKELQQPFSSETMQTVECRTPDSCSSKEGSGIKQSKLYSSPGTAISNGSLDYGNNFNFSPVYRLRSKRKAAFKSLEKQLDFTGEDANLARTTKVSSLVVNKNSCSPNMQFLSI